MRNFLDAKFGRLGNRLFQSAYIYAQFRDGVIPDIYLQDFTLFDHYRDELRELFKQDGPPLDYVSIHIRRGKNPSVESEPAYADNPFYVNLSETDYYRLAMKEFPDEKFKIFTDDKDWVLKQEMFDDCYLSHGNELEDFSAMTRCKGHIIANSSFSWWSAYISGKKTVAPSEWFSNETKIKYPEDWIVV